MPLTVDIDQYFEWEVKPHVAKGSWIDLDRTRIGYEINFTKYFYEYKGLESSDVIKEEIVELEHEISKLLKDLLG